jgi:acetolactate synthase small subunit
VAKYPATIVSEGPDGVVVRVTGPDRTVRAVLEELAAFTIVEVARSGPITLSSGPLSGASPPDPLSADAERGD